MTKYTEIMQSLKKEKLSQENEYLYFYRNMFNAYKKISWIYKNGYDHQKIKYNITKNSSIPSLTKELIEDASINPCILSLLIGLNRERLQNANSKVSNQGLFQYKDYESDASIVNIDSYNISDMDKALAEYFNFNPNNTGPFPYILEINKSDGRERPYDCITKIRNALEHAEYYIKKGEINITNITNHDDYNNLTFEGRLLNWSFRHFVEDFYGIGLGVSSCMYIYENPYLNEFKNKEDIRFFLEKSSCTKINFTKIPTSLKFNGKAALFSKLNSVFTYGGIEKENFYEVLKTLEEKGLECDIKTFKLSEEEINNILDFIENNYKDIFNNSSKIFEVSNILKLKYSIGDEVANCINNILRFLDFRDNYIMNNEFPNDSIFDEQIGDEQIRFTFRITLLLIKINLTNYLIENKYIELPDLSKLNINNIKIEPESDFYDKITKAEEEGIDSRYRKEFIILNSIRNAISHGEDRVKIIFESNPKIEFCDIYNGKTLKITVSLDILEQIYNNDIFNPENQIEKKDIKKFTI